MIEAGEDPRFIARRIMISAAEDIGMADPQALPIAVAAAEGVQLIGMPEGRILLAEAVVYLATAPKSNAAYVALDAAIADVRAGRIGRIPKPLREKPVPVGAPGWASQVAQMEQAGRAIIPGSCSVNGSYGFTGCTAAMIRHWFAERRMEASKDIP